MAKPKKSAAADGANVEADIEADDAQELGAPTPLPGTAQPDIPEGIDGGVPIHDPHPEIPQKTTIRLDEAVSISFKGHILSFREGKKAHVEPEVLNALKEAGASFSVVEAK